MRDFDKIHVCTAYSRVDDSFIVNKFNLMNFYLKVDSIIFTVITVYPLDSISLKFTCYNHRIFLYYINNIYGSDFNSFLSNSKQK